jgi:hypothetical protein
MGNIMGMKHSLVTALVVAGLVAGASPATAADTAPALSPEQQTTIDQLNTPYTVARRAATISKFASPSAAVYGARLTLYRGSALMWARDTMNWYYTGSTVSSSSLLQEAGYIFPNTSQAKGVTRYYASTSQHAWRGNYTIGAGIVTPWGAVTVYSQDYSTDWHVYGTGAGTGQWNN